MSQKLPPYAAPVLALLLVGSLLTGCGLQDSILSSDDPEAVDRVDDNQDGQDQDREDDRDDNQDDGDREDRDDRDDWDDDQKKTSGLDGEGSGLELASTPEFCRAHADLVGSMQVVGVVDIEQPSRLRVAYSDMERDLVAVQDLIPNAGVGNQIDELAGLYLPLVDVLRDADWDVDAVPPEAAAGLPILSPEIQPRLQAMTDDLDQYGAYECGHDIVAIREAAVDEFEYQFVDTAPRPDDDPPIGERGGPGFCAIDDDWLDIMEDADRADSDAEFLDHILEAASIYTTWGERLPVDLAVATVDMNVAFSQVVATFGETQDASATRTVYREWRSSAAYEDGRGQIERWLDANC